MRLINVITLELESFDSYSRGYAILSHRWGPEEVTYEDMRAGPSDTARRKQGFAKIQGVCDIASGLGYDYVWVDTCCIDKSSSAELSEAINSMFSWYARALCLAFLDDVTADGKMPLSESLWFTRGWTLQELIAPSEVVFYDRTWKRIGDRRRMSRELAEVTRIPAALLARYSIRRGGGSFDKPLDARAWLATYSVAAKMSWASRRETTRIEDGAYCLMGLFDVHMPLLYGEGGKHEAFRRLQEAIVRETHDMSILLHSETFDGRREPLACHASWFKNYGDVQLGPPIEEEFGVVITSHVLELTALTCPAKVVSSAGGHEGDRILALLNCSYAGDHLSRPALLYNEAGKDGDVNKVIAEACSTPIRIYPGEGTGERVYKMGFREIYFDLSKCKIQRLYIIGENNLTRSWGSANFKAPLRVIHIGQKIYRAKHTVMSSRGRHEPPFMSSISWMTDDKSDEFLILWGLVRLPDGFPQVDTNPVWWTECLQRCFIKERNGAWDHPPDDGDQEKWLDCLMTCAARWWLAPEQTSVTSRRPTGCEIHVATRAVDFLGRRDFEMSIEQRLPAPALETEISLEEDQLASETPSTSCTPLMAKSSAETGLEAG